MFSVAPWVMPPSPLPREAGHGEPGTAVVDRIGAAREIAQADVADPVAAVQADRRVQMVGVVVADPDLVDQARRDHPRIAGGEIASLLRQVRVAEHARVQLRALVVHEALKQVVPGQDLIAPHRRRVGIVAEVAGPPGNCSRRRCSAPERSAPSVFAKFEKRLEGITLPGNGRPVSGSMIGVARPEKLPASCVGFGTDRKERLARCRAQPLVAAKDEEPIFHHGTAAGRAGLRRDRPASARSNWPPPCPRYARSRRRSR